MTDYEFGKAMMIIAIISVVVCLCEFVSVYKLEQEVLTLKEELDNTENANAILIEHLKQLIGGR